MRRALVLTNEAARHPFRQSLPAGIIAVVERQSLREPLTDYAFFAISFVTGFIIFFGMIV